VGAAPWTGPLTPRATTTLGDGVPGADATVCTGAADQKLDGFSLVNSQGNVGVTGLTLAVTGWQAIQTATIWNEAAPPSTSPRHPASSGTLTSAAARRAGRTTPANFKVQVSYPARRSRPRPAAPPPAPGSRR
jgi:hypothetical protein